MKRVLTLLFPAWVLSLIAVSRTLADPIVVNESSDSYLSVRGEGTVWESGDISVPGGSTIGPANTIDVTINLSGTAETTSSDIYAGINGLSPLVPPGGEMFEMTLQLFRKQRGGERSVPI